MRVLTKIGVCVCECAEGVRQETDNICNPYTPADVCLLNLHCSLSQGQSHRRFLAILAPRQVQSTKCLGVISRTSPI